MRFKKILSVYKKEIKDSLRNRRILYSTIIVPLVILPVFISVPQLITNRTLEKAKFTPSNVMVSGFEIPGFFEQFARSELINLTMVKDPIEELRKGRIDLYVRVVNKTPPEVEIYYNPLSETSKIALSRVKLLIETFRGPGGERFKAGEIKIITNSVITRREMQGVLTGIVLGFLIAFGALTGGIAPGVDTIAGEKERKTLMVLLSLPISKREILAGKLLIVATISLISCVLILVGIMGINLFFFRSVTDVNSFSFQSLSISLQDFLIMSVLVLLYILIVSAVILIASSYARSYREAQNYITPLIIVIAVPMFFIQIFTNLYLPDWVFYIPGVNIMMILREALTAGITGNHFVSTLVSLVVTLYLAVKALDRVFERAILR